MWPFGGHPRFRYVDQVGVVPVGPCRRLTTYPGSVWRAQFPVGPVRGGIRVATWEQGGGAQKQNCLPGVQLGVVCLLYVSFYGDASVCHAQKLVGRGCDTHHTHTWLPSFLWKRFL